MVDQIKYEVVSPETKLAVGEAESILVPGTEGDFTVLASHAPYLSTLRPGILKIFSPGKEVEYFVSAGFVEVSDQGIVVLAERALEKSVMKDEIKVITLDLEKKLESAEGSEKDRIQKQLFELDNLL